MRTPSGTIITRRTNWFFRRDRAREVKQLKLAHLTSWVPLQYLLNQTTILMILVTWAPRNWVTMANYWTWISPSSKSWAQTRSYRQSELERPKANQTTSLQSFLKSRSSSIRTPRPTARSKRAVVTQTTIKHNWTGVTPQQTTRLWVHVLTAQINTSILTNPSLEASSWIRIKVRLKKWPLCRSNSSNRLLHLTTRASSVFQIWTWTRSLSTRKESKSRLHRILLSFYPVAIVELATMDRSLLARASFRRGHNRITRMSITSRSGVIQVRTVEEMDSVKATVLKLWWARRAWCKTKSEALLAATAATRTECLKTSTRWAQMSRE